MYQESRLKWNAVKCFTSESDIVSYHAIMGGRVVRRCWVTFQCRYVLLIWIIGQGPTVLAVGADGGCLDIFFSHLSFLLSFSLSGRRPNIDWLVGWFGV